MRLESFKDKLHEFIIKTENKNQNQQQHKLSWPPDEWFEKLHNQQKSTTTTTTETTESTQATTNTQSSVIILNESPANTQSISDNPSPSTLIPPQLPINTFRPPPIHPSRVDTSSVKETLDAHSKLSIINPTIKNDYDALFLIRNEVAIMKKINHPNLVRLHEVLDIENQDSLYMVMEFCPGGTLQKLVQLHASTSVITTTLPERPDSDKIDLSPKSNGIGPVIARKYFRQIVLGIDYLHRNEIIRKDHEKDYDIKPENILLTSNQEQIKIVDFGISSMFKKPGDDSSSTKTRVIGSPAFLSPELINSDNKEDGLVSGTATDIWAMGVTLYFMLTGSLPFPTNDIMLMYEAIETHAPIIPEEWDAEIVDLMSKILDKHADSRLKMAALKRHNWVTDSGRLSALTSTTPARPRSASRFSSTSGSGKNGVTDTDLKESFRFGFTNRCPVFSELVSNALKLSQSWKASHCSSSPSSNLTGRRRELFFKEFNRQISERTKLKFHLSN
ncbi:hypothetical protein PSTT_15280 [Puccinia striiformis]|uniref:Protein kinase domain-containing protein n=1 Tax=Puccinia striiformis TaxID=27350 RepID=A0A2S4UIH5_9BASI|nr:hypothetical protein PSTT_15280 [Puccinia striiformis]